MWGNILRRRIIHTWIRGRAGAEAETLGVVCVVIKQRRIPQKFSIDCQDLSTLNVFTRGWIVF